MQTYSGQSDNSNITQAIADISAEWPDAKGLEEGILFCFYPRAEQGRELAEGLAKRFPKMVIAGCSTAGEWLNGHHYDGNIVMMAMISPTLRGSVVALENIDQLNDSIMQTSLNTLIQDCGLTRATMRADRQVCVTMMDGLSMQEEHVSQVLAKHLINIPMVGGSSGDGLRFESTSLLIQTKDQPCRSLNNAALLLLLDSDHQIEAIKHQHFSTTDQEVIITSATPKQRIVHTLNGLKAADCYAQLVGCSVEDLSADIFSEYPLIYCYRDDLYVRSIQKVESDGSLTFYCAIEEGLILNLGKKNNIEEAFIESLTRNNNHTCKPHAALVFNCILRALESKHIDCCQSITQHFQTHVPHVIGFDTYGEQWNGLHINHTFTAVILHQVESLLNE